MDQAKINQLKEEAAYRAWLDLLSEFSEWNRVRVASLMAHKWTIVSMTLQSPEGATRTFTSGG